MASSGCQVAAPKLCDVRGLLIPDDIIRHREYIDSNPNTFWSSYQFYIKAGSTKEESTNPETILKPLSAIPDHNFSQIKSICVDFECASPFNFLRGKELFGYFQRLVGSIMDRGDWELEIKFLSVEIDIHLVDPRYVDSLRPERWCIAGDSEIERLIYRQLRIYFRKRHAIGDRIRWTTLRKTKQEFWDLKSLLAFRALLCKERREGMGKFEGYPIYEKPDEDYDNGVFKIDPISGEASVWKELDKPRYTGCLLIPRFRLMWDPIREHY